MVDDYVIVGRVGRAHGIRGEVAVEPRTDEPERRFVAGAVLGLRGQARAKLPYDALTVVAARTHQGRLLVRFEELGDRTAAEVARGVELTVPLDTEASPEDPEEFYDHQLVGLRVDTSAGATVGTLVRVEHNAAQDLLVVDVGEREVLVPFVEALVPVVDVAGGRVVVDDRPGLLREEP